MTTTPHCHHRGDTDDCPEICAYLYGETFRTPPPRVRCCGVNDYDRRHHAPHCPNYQPSRLTRLLARILGRATR